VRLLLDAMLGTPARLLRMCGHDAAYVLDRGVEDDDAILAWAREADRTLVTRDAALAARADDAVLLESLDVDDQLRELAAAGVDLSLEERPARCGACNGPVAPVAPDASVPDYAPDPATVDVHRCTECGQHFWTGSHWDDVRARLAALEP
jgi:hypothetical protein